MQEMQVRSLGWDDPLEEGMAPTPVFLLGECHGQRTLAGYNPGGHEESGRTEHTRTRLKLYRCQSQSLTFSALYLFVRKFYFLQALKHVLCQPFITARQQSEHLGGDGLTSPVGGFPWIRREEPPWKSSPNCAGILFVCSHCCELGHCLQARAEVSSPSECQRRAC